MSLSIECKEPGKKIQAEDYSKMVDYIRSKEYCVGLRDAYLIIINADSSDDAAKKLITLIECCENMRYITLKNMFGL